jgi:hypothetical protein
MRRARPQGLGLAVWLKLLSGVVAVAAGVTALVVAIELVRGALAS